MVLFIINNAGSWKLELGQCTNIWRHVTREIIGYWN